MFAMLGAGALIVCYLWWRLGSTADYRGPSPEQLEQEIGKKDDIESIGGDRTSYDSRPPPAELVDDAERRKD